MTSEPTTAERPALSDFALRALGSADAKEAAEVIRAAFSAQSRATRPPSSALREASDSIAAKISAGGGGAAFQGGSLVAVVLWQIDGDALHVGRVSMLPLFRGRGLTRRLIEACEAAARKRGARRMRLRVRLALPENERLFERFGFTRRSLEAHDGFNAPTTAVMEKRLS
jgi:GNAT superfamily N-acetyltransferase